MIYDRNGKPSEWSWYITQFYWATRWGSYT